MGVLEKVINNSSGEGPLLTININNAGSDYIPDLYTDVPLTTLSGDGNGATANVSVSDGKSIVSATIQDNGTGYTAGTYPNIQLVGGDGSDAEATIEIIQGGNIVSVDVTNGGSGYVPGIYVDAPSMNGDGTGATFQVAVSEGKIITSTSLTSGGSGYIDGIYTSVRGEDGSGTSSYFDVTVAGGVVIAAFIADGGVNYEVSDVLTLNDNDMGNQGTGATIEVLTVSAVGLVTEVQIIDAGIDYNVGNVLTISNVYLGNQGSGLLFDITDATGIGSINSVLLTNTGINYNVGNVLTATDPAIGAGSDFELLVQAVSPGGFISSVEIVNSGENYRVGDTLTIDNSHLGNQGSGLLLTVSAVSSGNGDVVGPNSSTPNAVVLFSVDNGKNIKSSGVTIDNENNVDGVAELAISSIVIGSTYGEQYSLEDIGETQTIKIGRTVNTTDATITTLLTLTDLRENCVINLFGKINARRTGGLLGSVGDSAAYEIKVAAKTIDGTLTVGTASVVALMENQILWDVTASASGNDILIRVQGAISNDITWSGNFEYFVSF